MNKASASSGVPQDSTRVSETWHLAAPHLQADDPPSWMVGINLPDLAPAPRREQIRVVVFDTGVEFDHPSLKGAFAKTLDLSRDFDHGFSSDGRSLKEGGQIANPFDAHGTACAGLVGARQLEGVEFVGVDQYCQLISVRISTNFEVDSLIDALEYAATVGDVLLLPRFLREDDRLTAALTDIGSRMPIVCASGNDGRSSLIYPARLPCTIAVGACNEKGYRSTYSQYGDGLDVVAPSNDVPIETRNLVRLDRETVTERVREQLEENYLRSGELRPATIEVDPAEIGKASAEHGWNLDRIGDLSIATTDNLGTNGYNSDPGGAYCKAEGRFGFGGTSAAAAQVAGVVSLMLSVNPALRGRSQAVQQLIRDTANRKCLTPEVRPPNIALEFGYGLVDAAGAVAAARAWKPAP